MRKSICFLVALLILNAAGVANDGAYLSRGGAIYPMKETRIAMKKEFLSFTCSGDVATVQVLFEFNNPDSVARKLLVGFQAPFVGGDVSDSLMMASRLRNMQVMVDGRLLPITTKAADCEDCPLGEVSSFEFHGDSPGIYVYLFEVTFQPGITRVQHSYDFTASSAVYFDRMFNYILTTGSKWGHSAIGDFTLEIDMGKDQYFYVSDVFGKSAEWSIVGTGQVTGHVFGYNDDINCRMVRTLSGKLRIDAKDFAPKNNIEFGLCHTSSFFGVPLEAGDELSLQVHTALAYWTLDMTNFRIAPLTKDDLRKLRNTIYAMHGHPFQDKELRAFYERFIWYIPDPNLENVAQRLSPEEQRMISEIVALEKTAK